MKKEVLPKQRGQTAVEYVVLLLAVVVIISSLYGRVRDYFLGTSNNCDDPNNKSVICTIERGFYVDDAYPFKYYTLRQ